MLTRIFFNQYRMGLKLYLRIPIAVFWFMAFPVLMLLGLGLSVGHTEVPHLLWSQPPPLTAFDQGLQAALGERGLRVEVLDPAAAEARWEQGKTPLMLEGRDAHYALRLNRYFAGQAMTLVAQVQQAFQTAQARASGRPEPEQIPMVQSSPGGHRDGPYAAYLLPGLIGLNLLTMGLFNVGMVDVTMRAKGGYKRLAATPLPRSIYLAAQLSVRLTMMLISATLLMTVGALVFGIHPQGSLFSLVALILLGTACFSSLGFVLGSLVGNIEGYGGLSNLLFLPLMLTSGAYFSLDAAPEWLQHGAAWLPLSPLVSTLRAVFNDGASLFSQSQTLLPLLLWTVLLFMLAVRRFRWV